MKQSLNIYERIEHVCKIYCINESEFCRVIGVKFSTFQTMMANKSKVPLNLIVSIIEHYDISTDWLVMGRGSMVTPKENDVSKENDAAVSEIQSPLPLPDNMTEKQKIHTITDLHQRNYVLQRQLVQLTYTNQQLVETNGRLIQRLLSGNEPSGNNAK